MSKAVKLDHKFDKDRFTDLLISAQGGRSQTEFANDCGISVAYICKCLNKKFEKAPIPSTLKKIAANAANGVTLENLLDAAGYDPVKYSATHPTTPAELIKIEKLAIATITSSLSKSNFKWSALAAPSKDLGYDFAIDISDGNISKWYFEFVHFSAYSSHGNSETVLQKLHMYYAKIIMTCTEPNSKYSFVTDSNTTFKNLVYFNPYMLAVYISVILIDTATLTIIKQEDLKTALTTDKANSSYSLP